MTTTASAPQWLPVIPDAIPRELTNTVVWYPAVIRPKATVGKWDKRPGDPKTGANATWSNPETRCTFGEAFTAYEQHPEWFDGIGYLLDEAHGLIGIDLDKCVSHDGAIAAWALEIVQQFDGAYWERSISGTGLRGFCRGTLPVGGCRSKIEGCSVELYADQRFLVVTGQAIHHAERLPTSQPAVDALHARLTAGRVRATGTTSGTGLTGPTTDLTQDEVAILTDVISGRWSERLLGIWERSDLHVAGASEDDWALESEIAYQAIRHGYEGDALNLIAERIMRAGPYRAKWDEARGAVSWLAQDVANATATVKKRLEKYQTGPSVEFDDFGETAEAPLADETLAHQVARLERDLRAERAAHARTRSVNAVQQTVIRSLRERLEGWKTVLSNPKLKPADRIAAIPAIEGVRAAQQTGQDEVHIRYPGIVKGWGLPESTVAKSMAVLTDADGAPLAKRSLPVLEEWGPNMKTFVRATADGDLYAAVGAYDPGLPQRGGKRPAPPQCKKHPHSDVIIRSVAQCATCRKPIAPAQEKTLCRQNEVIEPETASTVLVRSLGLQNEGIGGHDGEEQSERSPVAVGQPPASLFPDVVVSEEVVRRDINYTGTCAACQVYGVWHRQAGVTRCGSCAVVIHTEPWAAPLPVAAEHGRLPGFDPPPSPAPAVAERWYDR